MCYVYWSVVQGLNYFCCAGPELLLFSVEEFLIKLTVKFLKEILRLVQNCLRIS